MKCPKCSYTSFDYLDSCRKCGSDLREIKSLLQIISVAPEEHAPVFVSSSTAHDIPNPSDPLFGSPAGYANNPQQPSVTQGPAAEEELLSDLNFDRSFDDMVIPTSYRESAVSHENNGAPKDDDGLLDLDFGDVFAEKDKS